MSSIIFLTDEGIPIGTSNLKDEMYENNPKKFHKKGKFFKWYLRKFILPNTGKIMCNFESLGIVISMCKLKWIPKPIPITILNITGREITYNSDNDIFKIIEEFKL